jgi:hypothetical protein
MGSSEQARRTRQKVIAQIVLAIVPPRLRRELQPRALARRKMVSPPDTSKRRRSALRPVEEIGSREGMRGGRSLLLWVVFTQPHSYVMPDTTLTARTD